MIKLSAIPEEKYEEYGKILDEKLRELPPKELKLSLDTLFENVSGVLDVKASVCAGAAIPNDEWDNTYYFWFNINWNNEDISNLVELARTKEFNNRLKKKLRKYYLDIKDKSPESIQDVLDTHDSDEDIFRHLINFWYDMRYYCDNNMMCTDDLYSGIFRRQGLLSYFFESLSKVIDFSDLNSVEFYQVIERGTHDIFKKLKNRPHSYISEQLGRKYVKSPFLRIFNKVGLRDISIYTSDDFVSVIKAKYSDELKFHVEEYKDDF